MRRFFGDEKVNDKEFRENRSVYLKRHEVVGSKFFKVVHNILVMVMQRCIPQWTIYLNKRKKLLYFHGATYVGEFGSVIDLRSVR